MNGKAPNNYVSFILRLWRGREGEDGGWRASLEDPLTGERVGFGSLDEMFEFLRKQTTAAPAIGANEEVTKASEKNN
jgi:hypothetical protein